MEQSESRLLAWLYCLCQLERISSLIEGLYVLSGDEIRPSKIIRRHRVLLVLGRLFQGSVCVKN
jgi:hypothetical protein